MKMRKLLLYCFAICLAVCMMSVQVSAKNIASGSCGENGNHVTWTLDDLGVLTISGKGNMADYEFDGAGWYPIREQIKKIVVKDGITRIGNSAFYQCENVTEAQISSSVTSIGNFVFFHNYGLKNVVLPPNLTSIGQQAFASCTSLTKIELPGSLTFIDACVFEYCTSLTDVLIKGQDAGELSIVVVGNSIFRGCTKLEAIKVENHFALRSVDGVLYTGETLNDYPAGKKDSVLRVQNGTTTVGQFSAEGASYLQKVYLPTSLNTIGVSAFTQCQNLSEVYFTGDAPQIEDDAFFGVTATCYYPKDNPTWKAAVMKDYRGNLMWVDYTYVEAPTLKASNVASTGKIKLTWDAVSGAAKYELYRATSKNGTYTKLTTVTGTSATNTKTEAGKTYYYKIKAIAADGTQSDWSNIVSRMCDLPQPKVTATNVTSSGKIKLSWEKIEGATGYEIYRATSKTGTYTKISTVTGTSATNTKTDAGKTYYYKIRAIHSESAANSAYSSVVSRTCDLPQPKATATNVASTGKIKLSWNAVEGAVKYQILRSLDNENWEHLTYTTGTSATNTKTDTGKTYYYKVRAVHSDSAATSAYSAVVSRTCDLAQPTLTVKLNSKGKPSLSWNTITGAVKYQIVRSTDNKNWEHLTYTTNTSATNTKAEAGIKYYYKIRAIHSNTDATSAYSAVKYITTK